MRRSLCRLGVVIAACACLFMSTGTTAHAWCPQNDVIGDCWDAFHGAVECDHWDEYGHCCSGWCVWEGTPVYTVWHWCHCDPWIQ
jgi:hypothetical protein